MSVENLVIDRLIIHEVYARADDRTLKPPLLGQRVLDLSADAKAALQRRITDAIGGSSHGLEMAIRNTGSDSTFRLAEAILGSRGDDSQFVNHSQALAHALAAAQTSRQIPGGIVMVIDGRCNHPSQPFMAVIKAEPHAGFSTYQDADNLSLSYIQDLILTPQAKLYKIGLFLQTPQGCRALLYDHLISRGNRQAAAQYFYDSFLGLEFAANSAHLTQCFYSHTQTFIRNAALQPEQKLELLNALTTYLRTDQSGTIQVMDFADSYLGSDELTDAYLDHMRQQAYPSTAVAKDLSEIQTRLGLRKLVFRHNIKLTAPADQFDQFVGIETIDGEPDADGSLPRWTRITVRDQIQDQS